MQFNRHSSARSILRNITDSQDSGECGLNEIPRPDRYTDTVVFCNNVRFSITVASDGGYDVRSKLIRGNNAGAQYFSSWYEVIPFIKQQSGAKGGITVNFRQYPKQNYYNKRRASQYTGSTQRNW